jgi:phytoene/squalene synthetase
MVQNLEQFKTQTFNAIGSGYSTDLVIHNFAQIIRQWQIPSTYIQAFLKSMTMDITKTRYSKKQYESYIYGSAEVVGLMCLVVFCNSEKAQYNKLAPAAKSLGAGFQKVNFLRDVGADNNELGRYYFPSLKTGDLSDMDKRAIEADIKKDFVVAAPGIKQLPRDCRYAVWLAWRYYAVLLSKIEKTDAASLKAMRVSVSKATKSRLLCQAYVYKASGW